MEPIDLARGFLGGVVPKPDVVAVRVVNEGADTVLFLQPVRIALRLSPTDLRIYGGLLGFNNCQRVAIVIDENVVGITDAAFKRLMRYADFSFDLGRVLTGSPYLPFGLAEQRINN